MFSQNHKFSQPLRALLQVSFLLFSIVFLSPVTIAHGFDLSFAWDANTEPELAGYRVFCRQEGENYDYNTWIWEGTETTCTISGFIEKTTYYFVSRAYDIYGYDSENSVELCYDPEIIDRDRDGIFDYHDDFPDDPNEWIDSDQDGIGNNEDTDDDNDGMPDAWESQFGLNPLVDDASEDLDGDGVSNLNEYLGGTIPTNNVPDQPILTPPSNGEIRLSLTPELQTSVFSDSDNGNTHLKTQWQISLNDSFTSLVFDVTSNTHLTSLTVPKLVLDINTTYYWGVRFFDNHNEASQWSETCSFTTLVASVDDTDENGIPDDQEVDSTVDLDEDGTPDIYQDDIKSIHIAGKDAQMGVKISTNAASIEAITSIDTYDISETEKIKYKMPLDAVSFKIIVENAGDTASVIIYLSGEVPANSRWYKYDLINGWQDYSDHATLSEDRKSVTLELKDGGFGDADGTENGIIIDPSGPGTAPLNPAVTAAILMLLLQ